jgi:hypothetical protein
MEIIAITPGMIEQKNDYESECHCDIPIEEKWVLKQMEIEAIEGIGISNPAQKTACNEMLKKYYDETTNELNEYISTHLANIDGVEVETTNECCSVTINPSNDKRHFPKVYDLSLYSLKDVSIKVQSQDEMRVFMNPKEALQLIQLTHIRLTAPEEEYWKYMGLSEDPNTTMSVVLENLYKPWDWSMLSNNSSITSDDVQANINLPWDWGSLSYNPSMTLGFIEENDHMPWDWQGLTYNPNMTLEFINKYPKKNWDWYTIDTYMMGKTNTTRTLLQRIHDYF